MIWLTWRQFRIQAAVLYGVAAALLLCLALTGTQVAGYDDPFFQRFSAARANVAVFYFGSFLVLALPAVIGVFWGAPLVSRELEAGTHRLAWNQSVTRTRWLATKAGLTGLAAAAVTGLASLLLTWWAAPIDKAVNAGSVADSPYSRARLIPALFDSRGIAPIGYAVFALALGITLGVVLKRTVPAMAATLVIYLAVQIAVPTLIRPHIAPVRATTTITQQNLVGMIANVSPSGPVGPVRGVEVQFDKPGAWVVSNHPIDAAGHVLGELPGWVAYCVPADAPDELRSKATACFARLAHSGYRQEISYQPASRYWGFQAGELAAFLVLALGLTGLSFFWLKRLA